MEDAERVDDIIVKLEIQTEGLYEHYERLKISFENIAKGKSLFSKSESLHQESDNLYREGKSLVEKGESELHEIMKSFSHRDEISAITGHLNDQLSEIISLERSMAAMDLDVDPPSNGEKPSLKTIDEASSSSSQQPVTCVQVQKSVPSTNLKDQKDLVKTTTQKIILNPSSTVIPVVETSKIERYIFEKIIMIYELKADSFCLPDHTGYYPRINLLPGANPRLFKDIYEMSFLGTVYPSPDFNELSLIPDLFKELKQMKKNNVFLKFFQVSPEFMKEYGAFETYSLIEIGFVAKNFEFNYESNQPWKKTPNIDKDFTIYRRALGFKTVSSIIKNYLRTHYVLKLKPEFAIIGKAGGIRDAETKLEKIATQMVNHEFIGSMETTFRLCKMLKHKDCSEVLNQLQSALEECRGSPGAEYNPFEDPVL